MVGNDIFIVASDCTSFVSDTGTIVVGHIVGAVGKGRIDFICPRV